jgi:hypothetical protein
MILHIADAVEASVESFGPQARLCPLEASRPSWERGLIWNRGTEPDARVARMAESDGEPDGKCCCRDQAAGSDQPDR